MRKIGYIFFALLLGLSCQKNELPVVSNGDPVFEASFNLGEVVAMQAGVNGYSMTPRHSKDSTNLMRFMGELSAADCNNCGYGLTVVLNNHEQGSIIDVDKVFKGPEKYYEGRITEPETYIYDFKPLGIWKTDNQTFNWEVHTDTTKKTYDTYSLSLALTTGKTYTVKLSYDDGVGGCVTSHTRIFRVGKPLNVHTYASRKGSPDELNYQFTPSIQNSKYSYLWSFGDGQTSQLISPEHKFNENGSSYYCELRVINDKGDTAFSQYQVPGALGYTCQSNFSAKIFPVTNSKLFQAVEVLVTDKSGKKFSSKNALQPAASYFRILSESAYGMLGGNQVRKLKVAFECDVAGETGSFTIRSGSATLAIGYP